MHKLALMLLPQPQRAGVTGMCYCASLLLWGLAGLRPLCRSLLDLALYSEGRENDNNSFGSFESISLLLGNNVTTEDGLRETSKVKEIIIFLNEGNIMSRQTLRFFLGGETVWYKTPRGKERCLMRM